MTDITTMIDDDHHHHHRHRQQQRLCFVIAKASIKKPRSPACLPEVWIARASISVFASPRYHTIITVVAGPTSARTYKNIQHMQLTAHTPPPVRFRHENHSQKQKNESASRQPAFSPRWPTMTRPPPLVLPVLY